MLAACQADTPTTEELALEEGPIVVGVSLPLSGRFGGSGTAAKEGYEVWAAMINEAGEWVQVTVSDTGTGIPPHVLPHIFEPFFTTRAPLGSGLGLAQVHGIVAQHEGHIDVETQVGHGTTFTIYLPTLPMHPPEPISLEAPTLAQGQGETILVVEDDDATREALVESLGVLNYRVLEATNGQEALAILEQRRGEIALVLSDVVMPGMGSIALLRSMRQSPCPNGAP
jgi:two-component system cell cycle sensor histidine kinase/response regulator CckA